MANKHFSLKKLAIPIFLEFFLRYFSLIINTAMVAKYSNNLVGALGAGNQILDFFMIIFSFLSVGASIVIAQAIGAKNKELASKIIHQSIFLNLMIGICSSIFIFWQGDNILTLLQVPSELVKDSRIYLHMLSFCLFFDAVGILLACVIRVYNLAYFVMFVTLIMDLVIIVFNYYFLFYTNLELLGVGISTIIGRIVAILILLFVLFFKIKFKFDIHKIFLQKEVIKKVLNIGGYSAGENLLWFLQYTIAFSFVASLGKENLSVQTIYFQLTLLLLLFGQALSMANEIIIGKLVGANHKNIAYKHTWNALIISVIVTSVVVLINYAFKEQTMNFLDLLDTLKSIMLPLFMLSIPLEIARTFNIVMVNSLRASGDAKFPFYSGLIFMFGVSLPVGYVLCFKFNLGIVGIWLGFLADEFLRGIVNSYRWKSKKWQNKALV